MRMKLIATLIAALFITLAAYPAVAEDVYNTQVKKTDYLIAWGNGQDDDGDGVIDNWGEADVENGTRSIDPSNTTSKSWYQNFTQPNNLEEGVFFDAVIDEIIEVYSNDNISVSSTDSCYYLNMDYLDKNFSGYSEVDDVLNVATFYMNLSPSDIMNGAQEVWYRSPLVWNDSDNDYETHYLNVYDSDDNLVFASPNDTYAMPKPKYVVDNSSINGVGGERVYYKLNFNFRSDERYRFEEYVEIVDDNPINSVKLYVARAQDIGNDGETDTYVFKGTDYARKIGIESSWSMVCTIGIGRAGTEKVVFSNSDYGGLYRPTIYTNRFYGSDDVDDVGSATFIFPIRTTTPLNVSVSYRVWSGGDYQSWISPADPTTAVIRNATGTLIFTINISDPNASAPNMYQLSFTILNFDVDGEAMTYTMYPSNGDTHTIRYGTGDYNSTINHFATHIEITGEKTADVAIGTSENTVDLVKLLVGIGLIIGGLILSSTIISAPVGVPLIAIGAGVIGVGVMTLVGTSFVLESLSIGDETLLNFISDGLVRGVSGIVNGVVSIAGGGIEMLLNAWEILKDLGSAVVYWSGIVFEALAEIIWLFIFLGAIWIWSKFLDIMGYITRGNPEGALKSAGRTATNIRTTTRKYTPKKSTRRKVTKGIKSAGSKTKRWYNKRKED